MTHFHTVNCGSVHFGQDRIYFFTRSYTGLCALCIAIGGAPQGENAAKLFRPLIRLYEKGKRNGQAAKRKKRKQ